MTLKRRIEALEGSLRMDLDHCPACDPGPNTITITYKVNDLDPRTSPGEALAPHEVKQCPECGIITRVWVGG